MALNSMDNIAIPSMFPKQWDYKVSMTYCEKFLPASWEICMQVKKLQLELDMKQWTGFKLGKEYIKGVYCQPTYLNNMQSTSCKMPGCMKHKLESRCWEKCQ